MANDPAAPDLDSRSYADLVAQTEALAQSYTSRTDTAWGPNPPGQPLDLGSVLVRLFARMAQQVVHRLNRVPEKSHLAFLELLGAQQQPPLAARAPLTFHPIDGSTEEPVVPQGTPVSAPPLGAQAEAVFETESELVLTRTQLQTVIVRQSSADAFTDATDIATRRIAGTYEAFVGEDPVEHLFYLQSSLFSLSGAATIQLELGFKSDAEANAFGALPLEWLYSGAGGWTPFDPKTVSSHKSAAPGGWEVTVTTPPPIVTATVNGRTGPFIRATLEAPSTSVTLPAIQSLSTQVALTNHASAIDGALYGGQPLDRSKDFFPFGELPRFNDAFYVGASDAFSRRGVQVTLHVELSAYLKAPTTVVPLTLSWEAWDGGAWTSFTGAVVDGSSGFSMTGDIKITVPATIAPTALGGVTSYWIRARVVNDPPPPTAPGVTPAVRAPSLQAMSLRYSAALAGGLDGVFSYDDLHYVDWRGGQAPFAPPPDADRVDALYLGFDRAFANRAETLYFQVCPPTAADVAIVDPTGTPPPAGSPTRVVWEYLRSDGTWTDLGVEDDTRLFARPGLVRFIGPTDAAPSTEFGLARWWLRARRQGNFAVQPKLCGILTNTVWAVNAATWTNELLGTSDGSLDQVFTTAQAPVLLGQRVEVDEPREPSPDQLLALADLDGPDVVTLVPAASGRPQQIWVRWHAVPDFYGSLPTDRHYVMDYLNGRVMFGDGRRGLVPPPGANVRAARYQSGGGAAGNREPGTIAQFKAAVPFVDAVTNLDAAGGGSDAQTLEELKARTTSVIRHGDRAVNAQDYEDLAFEASPAVARAHAITPTFAPLDPFDPKAPQRGLGCVLVVVVPESTVAQPVPSVELLDQVREYLLERCAPAVTLVVGGPRWCEITVAAEITPVSVVAADHVHADVIAAIDAFLHPLTGGRDGAGWEFGRSPHVSDFYWLISNVAGVDHVDALSFTEVPDLDHLDPDPRLAERMAREYLIYSGAHDITVKSPMVQP